MNDPVANIFDAENATLLVAGCADAYAAADRGFSGDIIFDPNTDTLVQVTTFERDVVIAFRGTTDLRNWITDMDCAFDIKDGCRIHRGFARALDSVQGRLTARVFGAGYKPRRIWLTGHSLGGALAMLYAWRMFYHFHLPSVFSGIYTFGQPRVGDARFRDCYDTPSRLGETSLFGLKTRTFRVVHANDVVARVPWLLGSYRHAGHEIFFDPPMPPVVDMDWFLKLPYDIRNCYSELFAFKIALLFDHHVATYSALFHKTV